MERAGFWILTDLAYMQAAVPRVPPAGQSPVGLELCHWQPALADTFRQLLDASYEQTLDCPRLKGLRDTRDVIAGHRAVGLFEPELWTMASLDGQPAAAMLLNHVPTSGCVELVYLGVCPAFRRRGLAKALLQHALRQCAQRRIAHVTLAVDIHNAPALELYQGAGFYRTASKRVMMRLLTAKPGADRP